MKITLSTKVVQDDERGTGNGKCFYCGEAIDGFHLFDCVIPKKTVRVTYQFTLEEDMPVSWDEEQILFHHNEGGFCMTNAIDQLTGVEIEPCVCSKVEAIKVNE